MIESLNYQLRKITKTRGHFPSTELAIKLLYLGIRNITGRHIDGEGRFAGKRGTGTYEWNRIGVGRAAARFATMVAVMLAQKADQGPDLTRRGGGGPR
jgi:putative transposase